MPAANAAGFKPALVAAYDIRMDLMEILLDDSGLKAYVTNFTATSLSVCRECCGGHGYAAVNRFGMWRSDHDIFQTFEGDNTVLLQQVRFEGVRIVICLACCTLFAQGIVTSCSVVSPDRWLDCC